MSATRVRPSKVLLRSETLGCDLLSTIGYRAECQCGWRGPYRTTYRAARIDLREHSRGDSSPHRAA